VELRSASSAGVGSGRRQLCCIAEFNAGWVARWLDKVQQGWEREYDKITRANLYSP